MSVDFLWAHLSFLEVNDHNMKTLHDAQQDKTFMDRAEALSRIWDEAEKIIEDRQSTATWW